MGGASRLPSKYCTVITAHYVGVFWACVSTRGKPPTGNRAQPTRLSACSSASRVASSQSCRQCASAAESLGRSSLPPAACSICLCRRVSSYLANHAVQPRARWRLPMRRAATCCKWPTRFSRSASSLSANCFCRAASPSTLLASAACGHARGQLQFNAQSGHSQIRSLQPHASAACALVSSARRAIISSSTTATHVHQLEDSASRRDHVEITSRSRLDHGEVAARSHGDIRDHTRSRSGALLSGALLRE